MARTISPGQSSVRVPVSSRRCSTRSALRAIGLSTIILAFRKGASGPEPAPRRPWHPVAVTPTTSPRHSYIMHRRPKLRWTLPHGAWMIIAESTNWPKLLSPLAQNALPEAIAINKHTCNKPVRTDEHPQSYATSTQGPPLSISTSRFPGHRPVGIGL